MSEEKHRKGTGGGEDSEIKLHSKRKSKERPIFLSIAGIAILVIAAVIWLSQDSSSSSSNQDQAANATSGSSQDSQGNPSIYFPEDTYDFGTISQKTQVSHTFIVKNTGSAPLKLIKAKGS